MTSDWIIPCKINDFDCQTKSAKEYVATFAQGIPALELPALDPLFLDELENDIKGLKMNCKNINITGMEDTEIENFQMDVEKLSFKFMGIFKLTVSGDYTLSGKVLVLPIQGQGKFKIYLRKLRITVIGDLNKKTSDEDKEYWRISKYSYNLEPFDLIDVSTKTKKVQVNLLTKGDGGSTAKSINQHQKVPGPTMTSDKLIQMKPSTKRFTEHVWPADPTAVTALVTSAVNCPRLALGVRALQSKIKDYGKNIRFLASNIIPCKINDFDCQTKSAKEYSATFAEGIPSLGLPSLDPTTLNDVEDDTKGLKMKFSDLKLTGLKDSQVEKWQMDFNKLSLKFSIVIKVVVSGDYVLSGRLLVLPIEGQGKFKIDVRKLRVDMTADLIKKTSDDGKEYWRISKYTPKVEPMDVVFYFQNLFNGNEQLSDAVHTFANTNFKEVVTEVGGPLLDAIYKKIIKQINKYLQKAPQEELFIQ
ncbi:Protein takeout [Eumeta japonica]|uniref:Protein takeout n=1 Tax=Eumeta variegata TaxID=151549 RepID=A0A4C1VWA6_EUMVA|nr:Protein takeout [Eumeta japonica]